MTTEYHVPSPRDITEMMAAAFTPKVRARLLYHQSMARLGFWLFLDKPEEEGLRWLEQQMKKYDERNPA